MIRRTLIPLALLAGLIIPASASAKTYTAHDRSLHATITGNGTFTHPQPPSLTITRQTGGATRTLFHGTVGNRACGTGCLVSLAPADPPVRFAALDSTGSPDLLVNLYSGGANCCTILDLLRPSAALGGRYVLSASHNFAYAGYRLRKIGPRRVFITADPTFADAFTDFATSGEPLQILHLQGVRFVNVTAHYRGLLLRDAARWLRAYHHAHGRDNVGLIAAWAADEARLGRWRAAHAYLVSQARAGRLHSALSPHADSGMRFIAQLQALLHREGYLK